ncbi:acyl-CoA dehydrogenase family protein [Desulfopila inferna]|uniref:acyl-CoA dehydrogenase family protein n=1 Tax=Desulfopila inferna TaxID=468528 RepID=UPI0019645268|nr:acyl-CoA dehydrogenase family protein [Desulfopila inferna]MBM9604775.1 hypothetical protein [Desulfopila inferna]
MIFASEAVVYRLAGMIDDRLAILNRETADYYVQYQKGIEEYAAECALAKVFCTESAALAIDEMLQVHGGYGYIGEYPIEQLYRDERVQRIYEGTNEINRLLIAGMCLRKGVNAKGPGSAVEAAAEGLFAAEKNLLKGMKRIYPELTDHIHHKFGAKAAGEQEIMLTLADAVIQIFALESALLRAEKATAAATERQQKFYRAVVGICAFRSKQQFVNAVGKYAAFIDDDTLLSLSETIITYSARGLLEAKRLIAEATNQAGKYIF